MTPLSGIPSHEPPIPVPSTTHRLAREGTCGWLLFCRYCTLIVQAEASFVQLLRINPSSLIVLRNYAQFLLEVVNQDEKVCGWPRTWFAHLLAFGQRTCCALHHTTACVH